jgi:hypothetical protein
MAALMQAMEAPRAAELPRYAMSIERGRLVVVPCGHNEDALSLETTQNLFLYCQRCERGYDSPLILA